MILSLVSCCSVSKHTRVSCGEAENSFCVSGRQIMIFIKSDFYKCCESMHEPVILQWATHTHKCVLFPLYCVCCTQAVIESLKSCWLTKTRQTISFSSRKEKKPEEKLRLLFTDVFLKCWSISRSFGSLSALQTSLGTKRAVQTFSWSEADDWQLPNVYLWKHTHTQQASSGRSQSRSSVSWHSGSFIPVYFFSLALRYLSGVWKNRNFSFHSTVSEKFLKWK